MPVLTDQHGKKYSITDSDRFAGGGEGALYHIPGNKDLVIKLYHDTTPSEDLKRFEKKIEALTDYYDGRSPQTQKIIYDQIAWPISFLRDSYGNFRGFTMRNLSGCEELCNVYANNQSRYSKSDFSFAEKIHVAKNLCIAVNVMHDHLRFVVGDFNAKNFMVDYKKGYVYLIDADSFHLRYYENIRGRRMERYLPALVCRPEYLPPEMHQYISDQKVKISELPQPSFNLESDLFGLAIHIFQLLMNGTHPYGVKANPAHRTHSFSPSKADIGWAEGIKYNRYVYSKNPQILKLIFHYLPPDDAPPYSLLPDYLQQMFERAFVITDPTSKAQLARQAGDRKYFSDHPVRPTAAEWYGALDRFAHEQIRCKKNPRHEYGIHLRSCPWCEIDRKNGNK